MMNFHLTCDFLSVQMVFVFPQEITSRSFRELI